MPLIQDEAVTIRRLDFSETSQILVFFTRRHGKQRMIAKGVKRGTKTRFATGIDLLEQGEVVFSVRPDAMDRLGIMTEWHQVNVFSDLRAGLGWMVAGQYAAEVIDRSTEDNDPSGSLYEGLVGLLSGLPGRGLAGLVEFQGVLLREIGLTPDLSRCVMCSRPWPGKTDPLFSARAGGLVCRGCEGPVVEKRRVDAATLRSILSGSVTAETAAAAFDLFDYHLVESLGRPLELSRYVREVMFGPAGSR